VNVEVKKREGGGRGKRGGRGERERERERERRRKGGRVYKESNNERILKLCCNNISILDREEIKK